jgi:hypothetical protein
VVLVQTVVLVAVLVEMMLEVKAEELELLDKVTTVALA